MICELFPFQKQAVNEMRLRVAMALNNYRMLKIPQVVSLQAPTVLAKRLSCLPEKISFTVQSSLLNSRRPFLYGFRILRS